MPLCYYVNQQNAEGCFSLVLTVFTFAIMHLMQRAVTCLSLCYYANKQKAEGIDSLVQNVLLLNCFHCTNMLLVSEQWDLLV